MQREDVTSLLDVQRKVFNDIIDRLQQEIRTNREETKKSISDMERSLEFSQAETEELKKKISTILKEKITYERNMAQLGEENKRLVKRIEELEGRTDYLDDQRRQINLRFSGIQETEGENWQQCQKKVSRILQDHLKIDPSFERTHRVGKPSAQRPRDVIARFSSIADRDAVFRDRKKLKGSDIYINEDLCSRTSDIRKEQMDEFHLARKQGKIVYFNYRTLVVKNPPPTDDRRGRGEGVPSPNAPGTPTGRGAQPPLGARGLPPASVPPPSSSERRSSSVGQIDHRRPGTPSTPNQRGRGNNHHQRGNQRQTRQNRNSNR